MNIYFNGIIISKDKRIYIDKAVLKLNDRYVFIGSDYIDYTIEDDGFFTMVWKNIYFINDGINDIKYVVDSKDVSEIMSAEFCGFILKDDAPSDFVILTKVYNIKPTTAYQNYFDTVCISQKLYEWADSYDSYHVMDCISSNSEMDSIINDFNENLDSFKDFFINYITNVIFNEDCAAEVIGEGIKIIDMLNMRYYFHTVPLKRLPDYVDVKTILKLSKEYNLVQSDLLESFVGDLLDIKYFNVSSDELHELIKNC